MSDVNFVQRCALRLSFRFGHSAKETFSKLQQAYGDDVLSRAQVFRWFKAFSEESESIENKPRNGSPSSSKTNENVDHIQNLLRSDRRLTVRMIWDILNFTPTTVHQILTNELGMRKICAKMFPKHLSQDQKDINRERWNVSLLVTSRGCLSTTRKPSVRAWNSTSSRAKKV